MKTLLKWAMSFAKLHPIAIAASLALASLTGIYVVRGRQLHAARVQLAEMQLDAINAAAAQDGVTVVLLDSITRLAKKLIVQVKPAKDTALVADVDAHVLPLDTVISSLPRDTTLEAYLVGDGSGDSIYVRRYHFPVDKYPFKGLVAVAAIDQSPHATMHIELSIYPARIRVGVTCGAAQPPAGLRSALLGVQGPAWLIIDSVQVRQDPNVCNAQAIAAVQKRGGWKVPAWLLIPAGVAGYILAKKVL